MSFRTMKKEAMLTMFDLVPTKKLMMLLKRVCIGYPIMFSVILMIPMFLSMCSVEVWVVLSLISFSMFLFGLIPCLKYEKISQSSVIIEDDQIRICDKKGKCWRAVSFNEITSVRIEKIWGFFYGEYKDTFSHKYICIFLNDVTEIPSCSYHELFINDNFIIIAFNSEAYDLIYSGFKKQT